MADNTTIKNASGGTETIADDEITGGVADGAKVQRFKVGYGPDGSYVDVGADDPLPVAAKSAALALSTVIDGATNPDLPLIGPIDVSGYSHATIHVRASGDLTLDGNVVLWAVGGPTDDPVDGTWKNQSFEWPPDDPSYSPSWDPQWYLPVESNVDAVGLVALNDRYLMLNISSVEDTITAGSYTVDVLLKADPHFSSIQHVLVDQPVVIGSINGTIPTAPYVASAFSDVAAQDAMAVLPDSAVRSVRVEIVGDWVGTLTFANPLMDIGTGEWVNSVTGNGAWVGPHLHGPNGPSFAAIMTAYTSGTATVSMLGWADPPPVDLSAPYVDGAVVSATHPMPVELSAGSMTVDGTVSVANFPAAQPVTDNGGTLSVDDGGGSLTVDGAVSVSGTVGVGNWPAAQPVTDNGGSLTVDDGGGSITVDGTVTAAGSSTTASGSASSATDIIASADVSAYRSWSVQITGTWSGICAMQASNDGTTWATVPPDGLSFNGATNTSGAGITANGLFTGSVVAKYLRVRVTSYVSGTVSAVLFLTSVGEPSHALAAWDGSMFRPLRMDSTNDINALRTRESAPSASTLGTVAGSATSVTLLASNANRRGAIVWNESTATLYVALFSTASTSSYTWQVAPGGYLELPQPCYTGAIAGIWSAANGFARVTELST